MRAFLVRFSSPAAALVLALGAVVASRHAPSSPPGSFEHEVTRVRAHLARVEAELRAADVSGLTAAQRTVRARHLDVLRAYREAGVFPHNHVADRRTPVFVDEHGTHCAVGFLIAQSGRDDIVRRIARTRNYAAVPELADDPELAAWLDEAGFSVVEAARIQPWYGPIETTPRHTNRGYTTASIIGAGLGGGAIAWNLLTDRPDRDGTLPGVLGLGVGLGGFALGGVGLGLDAKADRDVEITHIALNFAVGLTATALGLRSLLAERTTPSSSDGEHPDDRGVELSVSPWTPTTGDGAGLRVNLRF